MLLKSLGYRFMYSLITLWLVVTIIFVLFRLLPGDPTAALVDPFAPPEVKAQVAANLGLDRPAYFQYLSYLGSLVKGDWGTSFYHNQPVLELIKFRFLNSFILGIAMYLIAYFFGGLTGLVMAWKRGGRLDGILSVFILFLRGAPPFWLGLVFIVIFSVKLGWFPVGGIGSEVGSARFTETYLTAEFLRHLFLPAVVGAIYAFATPTLLMRNTMLGVIKEDYMDLARAKGLAPFWVIFKHGGKNALLPLIAQSATFIGWAVGGLVSIEVVFSWPGLGFQLVQSISARDYPFAQGAFLASAILIMIMNMAADLVVNAIDPRVRMD